MTSEKGMDRGTGARQKSSFQQSGLHNPKRIQPCSGTKETPPLNSKAELELEACML